jgi:hypothetical protein
MQTGSVPPITRDVLHRVISAEALIITAICMLDLATTLFWISQGHAREGNPVMAWVWDQGHVPFIAVKILTFAPAVAAAEWYRPHNPVLITRVMRWTIILYLAVYIGGVGMHYGRALDFYRQLLAL